MNEVFQSQDELFRKNPRVNKDFVLKCEKIQASLKKIGGAVRSTYSLVPPLGNRTSFFVSDK